MNICALIVTYNRKELVYECLTAVLSQTYPVEHVVLFDNASTDGTYEYLEKHGVFEDKRIDYTYVKKNIGAAGAYSEAFKLAQNIECDWLWEMDDDTIPTPNCLKHLVDALDILTDEKHISFLASTIYGENCEYMNVPLVDCRPSENGYPSWYEYLDKGLLKIESATFVSLLFNKKAIEQFGIPIREFYMWGFDTEYTLRLTHNYGNAYFVGKSVAIHKRKNAKALNIEIEKDSDRIKLYRTLYESNFINSYIYFWNKSRFKMFYKIVISWIKAFKYIGKRNGRRIYFEYLIGGLMAIKERKKFERLIDEQVRI